MNHTVHKITVNYLCMCGEYFETKKQADQHMQSIINEIAEERKDND